MIKVTILILASLLASCDFVTRSVGDYSAYKDFDLSKTNYHIDTLNNGELILTEHYGVWGDHYVVYDRKGDRVVSDDTCYLKYRAYKFWENDLK